MPEDCFDSKKRTYCCECQLPSTGQLSNQGLLCSSWNIPVTFRLSSLIPCTKFFHRTHNENLHSELSGTNHKGHLINDALKKVKHWQLK